MDSALIPTLNIVYIHSDSVIILRRKWFVSLYYIIIMYCYCKVECIVECGRLFIIEDVF